MACVQFAQSGGGGGIARDHQATDAARLKRRRALQGIAYDGFRALRAIRQARGIAQVNEILRRQRGSQGTQHGQTADAGIEYADRSLVLAINQRRDQNSGRMWGNSSTSRMDGAFVNNITMRSTPNPKPAAGGMPYSSART